MSTINKSNQIHNNIQTRLMRGLIAIVWLMAFVSSMLFAAAETPEIDLIITVNIEGRFGIRPKDDEYMLALARNILNEKRKNANAIYVDGGNAFSPGFLSRFSQGSLMNSFFKLTNPAAVAVNSRDLRLSADLLEFLQNRSNIPLASANINKGKKTLFKNYSKIGNSVIIALSSKRSTFDAADQELFNLELLDAEPALRNALAQASNEGVSNYIVLSGREMDETLDLMKKFPQVKTWIAAGSVAKNANESQLKQVRTKTGSVLLFPSDQNGYYRFHWKEGQQPEFVHKQVDPSVKIQSLYYKSFERRLSLWQDRLAKERPKLFMPISKEKVYDSQKLMLMVRYQNRCDIGLSDEGAMKITEVSPKERIEVLERLQDETFIFKCQVRGSQVSSIVLPSGTRLQGMRSKRINNWPIRSDRVYSFCLSQRHLKETLQKLEGKVQCENTWQTYADYLNKDWERKKKIKWEESTLEALRKGELEFLFSNMIESANVKQLDPTKATPPGRPADSYFKWGLENTIHARVYNGLHEFSFTPYLYYMRQDDTFLQNLLRFTANYRYQWFSYLMPYLQGRYETALVEVQGKKPSFVRQTAGFVLNRATVEGKLGLGYEKRLRDPSTPPVLGLESQIRWEWQIYKNLKYRLNWEAFFFRDFQTEGSSLSLRSELANRLSYSILDFLDLTFAHRWFYFSDPGNNDRYDNQQFTISGDLRSSLRFDL